MGILENVSEKTGACSDWTSGVTWARFVALLVTMPRPWRRYDPGVGQGAEGHGSPSKPISALRCNTLGAVNTRQLQPQCRWWLWDTKSGTGETLKARRRSSSCRRYSRRSAPSRCQSPCGPCAAGWQPPAPGALPSPSPSVVLGWLIGNTVTMEAGN